jgi:hypothetical protein
MFEEVSRLSDCQLLGEEVVAPGRATMIGEAWEPLHQGRRGGRADSRRSRRTDFEHEVDAVLKDPDAPEPHGSAEIAKTVPSAPGTEVVRERQRRDHRDHADGDHLGHVTLEDRTRHRTGLGLGEIPDLDRLLLEVVNGYALVMC